MRLNGLRHGGLKNNKNMVYFLVSVFKCRETEVVMLLNSLADGMCPCVGVLTKEWDGVKEGCGKSPEKSRDEMDCHLGVWSMYRGNHEL